MDAHIPHVLGGNPFADPFLDHGREEFPLLIFLHQSFRLIAADLFIQRVKKLLAGGGAGKGGAVKLGAAEAAEVQQTFRGAAEHDAHPVHQVNNGRSRVAHAFYRRLVGEKIPAVNRIVKVQPGGISFTFGINGAVNSPLSAYGV